MSLLDRILEPGALSADFQPVWDLHGATPRVSYFEGFVRGPRGSTLERPEVLFSYARRKHAELPVDRAAARAVLSAARSLPGEPDVGLNVHGATLAADLEFVTLLGELAQRCGIDPARLVVEVVEHSVPWDFGALREALRCLRDIGVRIGLDDVGTGYSNFLMVLECRPDIFKVDGHFVRGAERDFYRRALLRSLAELAVPFGARVVAEGVETGAELAAVREAGIAMVQGFFLGSPAPPRSWRRATPGDARARTRARAGERAAP